MKFDLVMIHDSLMHAGHRRKYVQGKTFYKHPKNKLYSWSILKLHGSLNWFRYIPPDATPPSLPRLGGSLIGDMGNHIIIGEGDWGLQKYPIINNHYVEPVLVTPDIYKRDRFTDPIFKDNLLPLWKQAKEYLSKCRKLVVIGYSFPDSDDLTKELFESSFTNNALDKLIVVNPDHKAVEKAKSLCNAKEVVQLNDLKEFIEDYKSHLP